MPVAIAEAVCGAVDLSGCRCLLSAEAVRWWVCTMVEPQRVPVWVCEARCEAVCLARWCAVPVAIAEAVCVPFLCPMVGVLMA